MNDTFNEQFELLLVFDSGLIVSNSDYECSGYLDFQSNFMLVTEQVTDSWNFAVSFALGIQTFCFMSNLILVTDNS